MINLMQYDNIIEQVDKSKTWFNPNTRFIYSREIANKKYYSFKRKWSDDKKQFDYFLILSDKYIPNSKFRVVRIDDDGRMKLRLDSIFKLSWISSAEHDVNINIQKLEEDNESVVYQIDL